MIHRRNRKQWLSKFFLGGGKEVGGGGYTKSIYYKQCENSECNILFFCFQQHFCYEWKAKSDTFRDFKSFIQANINLFIPNWYLISWALNFAKLKNSNNISSGN